MTSFLPVTRPRILSRHTRQSRLATRAIRVELLPWTGTKFGAAPSTTGNGRTSVARRDASQSFRCGSRVAPIRSNSGGSRPAVGRTSRGFASKRRLPRPRTRARFRPAARGFTFTRAPCSPSRFRIDARVMASASRTRSSPTSPRSSRPSWQPGRSLSLRPGSTRRVDGLRVRRCSIAGVSIDATSSTMRGAERRVSSSRAAS